MFRRLPDRNERLITFTFDGVPITARQGDSVAAALLAVGHNSTRRTAVTGAARGPFCMMGVCFECLVRIDGRANWQACMIAVREGMRVETQDGAAMAGQVE